MGTGIGICTYFSLDSEPETSHFIWYGYMFAIAWVFCLLYPWIRFIMWPLFSVYCGFAAIKIKTDLTHTPMLNSFMNSVIIEGVVEKIEQKPRSRRITIKINTLTADTYPKGPLPDRVLLKVSKSLLESYPNFPPNIGSLVKVQASLSPFSFPASSRGFNFRRQNFYLGIGASGSIKEIISYKASTTKNFEQTRLDITNSLQNKLPGQTGAIAAALLTGDRSGIESEVRDQFISSGLAHILAISGLHLTLLAGIVFLIIRTGLTLIPFLANRFHTKKWAALLVILACGGYLVLSGFPIPTQRAFVMTGVVMFGIIIDRNPISMRLFSIAGSIILLIFPESLLSASFQLSFAAVLGLLTVYEKGWAPLSNTAITKKWYGKIFIYGIGVTVTSLVAMFATTPYTMFLFNRFSLQGLSANILAIPLTAFIIMPALVGSVVFLSLGKDSIFFEILHKSLEALMKIAEVTSQWPGAIIYNRTPSYLFITLFTLGMLWLAFWKGKPRYLGIGAMALAMVDFFYPISPLPDIYLTPGLIAIRDNKSTILIPRPDVKSTSLSFQKSSWLKEWGNPDHTLIKELPYEFNFTNNPARKICIINEKIRDFSKLPCSNQKALMINFSYFSTQLRDNLKGIDRSLLTHHKLIEGYINKSLAESAKELFLKVRKYISGNSFKMADDNPLAIKWEFPYESIAQRPWG